MFDLNAPRRRPIAAAALLMALGAQAAWAADTLYEDEQDLAAAGASMVSIAAGRQQALRVAPAAVSVITAADIAAMGATEINQVLETVPGLHILYNNQGYTPIYAFRGIATALNPQVLMMLNGLSLNISVTSNRGQVMGDIPLENVERIEVIRGPGSALYGADAFAGVINIITKNSDDLHGVQAGGRVGSWRTRDGWLQYGGDLGPVEAAFYLARNVTAGQDGVITQDLQGQLDARFHTHASNAPGPVYLAQSGVTMGVDLAWQDWRVRANYQFRKAGLGTGIADSLEPPVRGRHSRLNSELIYQKADWAPNWDVGARLEYSEFLQLQDDEAPLVFPPGAFGGLFPQGAIGIPTYQVRRMGLSGNTLYSGLAHHRLLAGAGYEDENLYKVTEVKNFMFNPVPGAFPPLLPLPGLIDAANNAALAYLLPARRKVNYQYLQDEWNFARDWTLTAGLRRDDYSDFGATTNPRTALVWDAAYNLVVKALYGRAFRAPSFVEEYPGVNPVVQGNPGVQPEKISTSELVFAWQASAELATSLTLFHYHERSIIKQVANQQGGGTVVQNVGDQSGRGLELEGRWQATPDLRLTGNYSLQHSRDAHSGLDAGWAPHRHVYARADWRIAPEWQMGLGANYVADRVRPPGDRRAALPDYTAVDLTLRREKLWHDCELRLLARNLLDRDIREPDTSKGNIPNDLPMPRRNFAVQLQRQF